MLSFLIKLLANIIALFIVIHTVAGVSSANWQVTIIAAFTIGLLNAFLRPVLIFMTLPLTIFSLGAFTLIINAFMFYLASKFVPGFTVASFWSAFWAALLFSVLSFIFNLIFTPKVSLKLNIPENNSQPQQKYDNIIDVEGEVVDHNVDHDNPSTELRVDDERSRSIKEDKGE